MKRKTIVIALTGAALIAAGGFALAQQAGERGGFGWRKANPEMMQRMLDGRIAGTKAALRLSAEQERLWPPVETALKAMGERRIAMRQQMMDERRAWREARRAERQDRGGGPGADQGQGQGQGPGAARPQGRDLVERLERRSEMAAQNATALRTLVDALRPLYVTMSDEQKQVLASAMPGRMGRKGSERGHGGGWHHGDGHGGGPRGERGGMPL